MIHDNKHQTTSLHLQNSLKYKYASENEKKKIYISTKLYKASPSDRFFVIDICQTQVQAIHFSPDTTLTPLSPTILV